MVGAAVAGAASGGFAAAAPSGRIPGAPTALALCKRYRYAEVRTALAGMLEQVCDLGALARRKRVVVKLNLVNSSEADVAGVPLWLTVTTHPNVAMALGSLLVRAGAREVVFCDQLPFAALGEEAFAGYGYKLSEFNQAMDGRARFVNTRNRGAHRDYALVKVPNGELATAFEVNRTYADADVLVSVAKLKSHVSGGVTGVMKNLFGVPPSSLYGDDLKDEPDEGATGYRSDTMHNCTRTPKTSVTTFTGRSVEGDHGHNVPRFIVDLASALPISLGVIDGISAIQSAEGWWIGSLVSITRPGLLIAGTNPVCVDATAAAVMGFDPDAPDRTWPFVNGTNHLALARRRGLGENRQSELEVVGMSLEAARHEYEPTYRRIGDA
jgi:uncharacterized protein (DUF362 family)